MNGLLRRKWQPDLSFWSRATTGLVIAACVAFPPHPCAADVDSAVAWLLANQSGGSYWGDVGEVRLHHTATVVEVLRRLGVSGTEVTTGAAWLSCSISCVRSRSSSPSSSMTSTSSSISCITEASVSARS